MCIESSVTLTLWDGQEANQNEGILMSPPDVVTHVPDRKIDRVIFVLTGCDRSCRFVTSEYDGDKDCSVRINIR